MSRLGFRRFEDMIGRVDLIEANPAVDHWKARGLDLQPLLMVPEVDRPGGPAAQPSSDRGSRRHARRRAASRSARARSTSVAPVRVRMPVRNVHRCVGAMLSGEIARRHGAAGLPDGTIDVELDGAAGQSFGAWLAHGVTLTLRGEANDYVGKGLSGGRLVDPAAAGRRGAVPRRTSSSATSRCTARPRVRRSSAASPASASACATPERSRSSRESGTTAAST